MRLLATTVLTAGLISLSLVTGKGETLKPGTVQITWVKELPGDFSFKDQWDYPEGVYRNTFGQLSCDGFCPVETDEMKDENGRIFDDSLAAFYRLVDTTHLSHSIQSDAWCYEWAGTNYMTAKKVNDDTVTCFTHLNAGTHCSLELTLAGNTCTPVIELNSVVSSTGTKIYTCNSGRITIDKKQWDQGILKASFNFVFNHPENSEKPMFWKGNIYTTIHTN